MRGWQPFTQVSVTDEAVSPLRRRIIEDMTIRKFAPNTLACPLEELSHSIK
jgi:hypothetical protein